MDIIFLFPIAWDLGPRQYLFRNNSAALNMFNQPNQHKDAIVGCTSCVPLGIFSLHPTSGDLGSSQHVFGDNSGLKRLDRSTDRPQCMSCVALAIVSLFPTSWDIGPCQYLFRNN